MEAKETREMETTSAKPKLHRKWLKVAGSLVAVVILIIGLWVIFQDRHQISSLQAKNTSLTRQANKLQDTANGLATKNANLSKTIKALQTQVAADPAAKISNSPSASSAQTPLLTITGVKMLTPAYFGDTLYSGKDQIVFFTLQNKSQTAQTYNAQQFKAITDTGEVVSPAIYTTGSPWYTATLAANGTANGYLSFDPSLQLATLEWTPPETNTPIDISLPPVQE